MNAQATYEKSVFAKTNRTLARGEGAYVGAHVLFWYIADAS